MDRFANNNSYFEQLFEKLSLASGQFRNIEFEGCEFKECDFSDAHFAKCKFIDCRFYRCNLSLISVPNSQFFTVEFIDSKLVGIDWTRANWPRFQLDSELTFSQCVLNDASFFGLTFHSLVLQDCKLRDVDFREGTFTDSQMTDCDFTNSQFMRTNLQGVDFSESTNFNINLFDNKLERAKFSRYEALNLLNSIDIELVD